ncbi:MAG: aminotransferase class III-fold pyridoxal phosphate-dependent enzyme [Trueperaceae bacterium]|nr:aminotransferase class III-fold pyridoxal phosphate-dependent enzyme [Trueperaceae bacterium]
MSLDALSNVWTHLTQLQPVRGEGIYLYDDAGQRYSDFTSGIGVVNTGHCHPEVVTAIKQQAEKLIFGQINCVVPPQTIALAETLRELTPPSIDTFFFSNSGAEATEGALKLARHATQRTNVIVFQGSFHGRTSQAMAMTTSKTVYRYKYHPLPSGVFVAPFPYAYYYGWDEETTVAFCLKGLEHLLKSQCAPDETACMMIEPVLGEGGYVPAPTSFLQGLRKIADKYGILLVIDEVQSGFGRTGKFFCYEYADVEPDIIVMAKGLGSGMPISGIASRKELMDKWLPGTHGGTYGGGNAVVMAAAKAGVEAIMAEDLHGNAARMGDRLMQGLRDLQLEFPSIGDVRGLGLMVATEFSDAEGNPDGATCQRVHKAMLEQNTLLLTCGTYGNIIRWIPPLVVNAQQIDEALAQFRTALEKATTVAA